MTDRNEQPPGRGAEVDAGVAAMPDNIRSLQALHRYTDEQMADAIGVSTATWQRRKTQPELWTLQQARRIARVLDVDLARLTTSTPPGKLPGESEVTV